MRAIRARQRLELQEDIKAAMAPVAAQAMRMHLADEAFHEDSPEYVSYVSSMAAEKPVSYSE